MLSREKSALETVPSDGGGRRVRSHRVGGTEAKADPDSKPRSDGDRRSFHLLNKLTRKYGCGPNKRQDCYACLRDGKDLDAALKAVKARREPRPFGG